MLAATAAQKPLGPLGPLVLGVVLKNENYL